MSSDMTRVMSEEQKKKYDRLPKTEKVTYKEACTTNHRKVAIKAFCRECMGYEHAAVYIRGCTAKDCPLYEHRPYKLDKPGTVE